MRNPISPVIWIGTMVFAVATWAPAQESAGPRLGLSKIGQGLFAGYCTSCHGAEGRGDGPVAEYLKVAPADLTKLVDADGKFPFDEVLKKIDGRELPKSHGSSDMPIWGDALHRAEGGGDEDEIKRKVSALAHYLWSIQAGGEKGSDPGP